VLTAGSILTVVAVVLIIAAVRDTPRRGALGPSGRTWLMVAAIFVAVTIFLRFTNH
jgi:hypothetical protein